MELQHIVSKIFVEGELPVDQVHVINLFHDWIKQESLPELLIDVADYRHVPSGPGVMLIAHEADYNLDFTDGRCGLRYNRKAAAEGSNEDKLKQAFSAAAVACERLEAHFASDGLRFSRTNFEIQVNDRAIAPNTPETDAALRPIVEGFVQGLPGNGGFELVAHEDRRRLSGYVVTCKDPIDWSALG
ncbi:MAG: hypothetical protein ACPGXK_04940 [Phycisphaerae bacterium]